MSFKFVIVCLVYSLIGYGVVSGVVFFFVLKAVVVVRLFFVFFFKQKTAYEMRISDWSSDVCSSDLRLPQSFSLDDVLCSVILLPAQRRHAEWVDPTEVNPAALLVRCLLFIRRLIRPVVANVHVLFAAGTHLPLHPGKPRAATHPFRLQRASAGTWDALSEARRATDRSNTGRGGGTRSSTHTSDTRATHRALANHGRRT